MSDLNPQDQSLVDAINASYAPPTPQPEAFDDRLRSQLNRSSTRPLALGVLLAAAGALLVLQPPVGEVNPSPKATPGVEAQVIDTALVPDLQFDILDGFDPYDSSELPETYQTLALLFFDQETP